MSLVLPETEAALAEAVRAAHAARTPVRIVGGGTRGGRVAGENVAVLGLSALTGVRLYEPGALTLVAAAGTPVAEIEALLAAEGQALAFEPMDHRALLGPADGAAGSGAGSDRTGGGGAPTIGGVVATNASGPRRVLAGACRDHLLGVRFVDGQGRALRSGGRVMKNVTGLDLGKLLCGARGTLGILTEVALKVLPAPRRSVTLAYPGRSETEAVALFCAALRTPYEVSGAAWRDGTAWLRIEGSPAQAAHRLARLGALFGPAETIEGEVSAALWRDLRDARHFAGAAPLWRIGVRPTDAPAIARALGAEAGGRVSLDWGGALVWAEGAALTRDRIRAAIGAAPAQVSRLRGPEEPAAARGRRDALVAGLRARFDPAGILNPGLAVD